MKYTLTNRRKSITVRNNKQFVRWMRKSDLQFFKDNAEFMEAYSLRKKTFENIILRFENEDAFVEDLQKNNLLIIEKGSWFSFQ
ncbi:MAG: hypothetical protein Q4G16_04710 [Cruoricaptor ignavus]|nr:hypothetical protein [Cruoricaptor ignavus]